MIKISISDGFSKSVELSFDSATISMITRFLHYISYADNLHYKDSSFIQKCATEFFDTNYDSSMIQDAKVLKAVLDYVVNRLV